MRIAVDAMGGDFAPATVVEGAVLATRLYGHHILLVGEKSAIRAELKKHRHDDRLIAVHHASQVVEMQDSPSTALRRKKDSSIRVAVTLVKAGEAAALVSAGHTGATMATALFVLGLLPGVERPAIATLLPTLRGRSIMVDVGANVDCKPIHLLQFGLMGHVYARHALGKAEPTVGLLSIGEEDTKGNDLTREAFKLLKASPLRFIGNVEGRDVFSGNADVIVCDGFIGNVALKISEGVADVLGKLLKREIAQAVLGKVGYLFLRPAFNRFRRRVDYAEYGGAPLLGVNGICIISHGRSSPKAIKNAIRVAAEVSSAAMHQQIQEAVQAAMPVPPAPRPAKMEHPA